MITTNWVASSNSYEYPPSGRALLRHPLDGRLKTGKRRSDAGLHKRGRYMVVSNQQRLHLGVGALLLAAGFVSTACGGQPDGSQEITLVPAAQLPVEIQRAPPTVREAYQFAAANGAILKQVPCYCGCRAMGHTSVHSCYVSGGEAGQPARFDLHALGCAICVDTVRDAIRMTREGADPVMIRSYIDRNYSKFGTSNMS